MRDVKELFSPERQRLLRGEPPELPFQAPRPRWQSFPDPAVGSLLQQKADSAVQKLQSCGSSLQICKRDITGSRHSLRQCRTQLESHQASSAAVCELLAGWRKSPSFPWMARAGHVRQGGRRCLGRVRCFFCRERRALEDVETERLDFDSAALADVSSSSSEWRTPSGDNDEPRDSLRESPPKRQVQRRKTSRERGRKLYKLRTHVQRSSFTWYALHTVDGPQDPLRGPRVAGPSPFLSRESSRKVPEAEEEQREEEHHLATEASKALPDEVQAESHSSEPEQTSSSKASPLPDAELEPYTSAAARFRAEMEFLDMSSFPASPEVHDRVRRASDARGPAKPRPLALMIELVEAEAAGPPAPPPSTSQSWKLQGKLEKLEARDPLRGWKQLLVSIIARRRDAATKILVLRG